MSFRATAGITLALVLVCAPAPAQQRQADLARQIALFSKGRPATMSADDWHLERIGLFARLKDLARDGDTATGRPAIPLLVAALNEPDPTLAEIAAGTLLVVDPVNSRARALAGLAAALKSGSDQAQQWALDDLAAQGVFDNLPADVEAMLTTFARTEANMNRPKAVRALRTVPPRRVQTMTAVLVTLLADRDRQVRFAAVESLEHFGPRAALAVPSLRQVRATGDADLRKAVDQALVRIESTPAERAAAFASMVVPAPPPITPANLRAVEQQLQSRDLNARFDALRDIDTRRASAGPLVPALTNLLNDPERSVRYVAAYVLTSVDRTRAAPALPLLTELLRSNTGLKGGSIAWNYPGLASSGLGRLGRPGADVLVGALADASFDVRMSAMLGLETSDVFPPAAVPALVRLTRDPDENARGLSMMVLRTRRAPAPQVIGALADRLNDSLPANRVTALRGLMELGAEARPVIAAVRRLTTSPDADLAFAATATAVVIDGGADRGLIPRLLRRFESASAVGGDYDLEAHLDMIFSSQALARYGADARAALPALNRAFDRETGIVRGYVGVALAAIDPATRPRVVSALTGMLAGANDNTRPEFQWALAAIQRLQ